MNLNSLNFLLRGHLKNVLLPFQAITQYHRILDVKKEYTNTMAVLKLADEISSKDMDNKDNILSEMLKLLARITSSQPSEGRFWKVYGDMLTLSSRETTATVLRACKYYQKALGCFSRLEWTKNDKMIDAIADTVASLVEGREIEKRFQEFL